MTALSRRSFLKNTAAAGSLLALQNAGFTASATPLGLPLGLQLYSVREQLPKDYEGTLQKIAAIGYKEVEAAGFYGHDADQVNAAMKNAGLHCVSAHYAYDALHPKLSEIIGFGGKLGLEYIICAYPGYKDPQAARNKTGPTRGFTIEDWRWNADQFNQIGEQVRKAGMRFGYHNHTIEFAAQEGVVPYEELLRLTDPAKVTMEMDCGWVIVGGGRPETYLSKHADRISMLHVKDFKEIRPNSEDHTPPTPSELGQGSIDYKPIFAAAKMAKIKHIFVEQEAFDMPWTDSLKVDATYMQDLKA